MEEKTAPEVETKETEEIEKEVPEKEAETPEKKEETIEETFKTEEKEEKTRMVPESALLKQKREKKELAKELKELKNSVDDGANKGEVSKTLEEISEKHDVSKAFLKDLLGVLKIDSADIDDKIDSKLKPITDDAKARKIDSLFNKVFKKTLETMPEYKDIVDKEVIKALTLNPANKKKTFSKIIEDTYGKFISGKKTLEKTNYREGEKITSIDFKKAKTDVKYFKAIMDNPALKKKYNDKLISTN